MATILVVDDGDIVLAVVGRTLERAGHKVVETKSPEDALHAANLLGQIDLLIVNHLLKGTSGREIAEKIRAAYSAAKVLHISGHPREKLVDEGTLTPGGAFLQKPFLPKTPIERVEQLLR